MADEDGFVADGGRRWWDSPEGVRERARVEAEGRSRYADEFRRATWYSQLWLEWRMQREISAEFESILWAKR